MKEKFCYFIDNSPQDVDERLKESIIKKAEFKENKQSLKLILENGRKLEITLNNKKNGLWLFLTE